MTDSLSGKYSQFLKDNSTFTPRISANTTINQNDNMLQKIIDIVRQAAGLMVTEGFVVNQKEGFTNIVTSSDLAVQHFLCEKLAELIPGSGFFCEEEDLGHDGNGDGGEGTIAPEYVWIIDPIDGTANYSRGIDHCCISVALSRRGEVVAGVVYSPMRDELYCAEKDHGASCNGIPIKVSGRSFENGILCSALCLYRKEHAQACSDIIMETYMQCNDVRRFGAAALEICFLACGRIELYFEYRLLPWDFAAAKLILTEAGGVMSGIDGCEPSLRKAGIIVAANSPANHRRLLEIVQKHI